MPYFCQHSGARCDNDEDDDIPSFYDFEDYPFISTHTES